MPAIDIPIARIGNRVKAARVIQHSLHVSLTFAHNPPVQFSNELSGPSPPGQSFAFPARRLLCCPHSRPLRSDPCHDIHFDNIKLQDELRGDPEAIHPIDFDNSHATPLSTAFVEGHKFPAALSA